MRALICLLLLSGCSSITDTRPFLSVRYESVYHRFHLEAGSSYPDSLGLPFPNPFNSAVGDTAVHIVFSLKDSADVKLLLQNAVGDSIVVFRSERLGAGLYSGSVPMLTLTGDPLRSGLYFITLRADPDKRNYINSRLIYCESN